MKVTSLDRRDLSQLEGRGGISLFILLQKRLYEPKKPQIFDFLSIRAYVPINIFNIFLIYWYSDSYI